MTITIDDTKCDMETALAWSTSAKNCLLDNTGFSPNQLVIGRNINLPSVEKSNPPALESSRSNLARKILNALHSARENYIKAESSERIKRALRHQVRIYSEVDFQLGEKVYYKRRQQKNWRGPTKVFGKETNFVLIRHETSYYRCHPFQLMKVIPEDKEVSPTKSSPIQKSIVQYKANDDEVEDGHDDE